MTAAKYAVCFFCCLALLCGCASRKTPDVVKAEYYPTCHEPLAYLQSRSGTGSAAAAGAMQGAVISGIAAGIIGAIAGGIRPAGILTSIGVGAAVGGVAGGAANSQQKEDNAHLAAYLEQIEGDITDLDIVGAAATVSMQCYNKEYKLLLEEMKKRQISREGAVARFDEIAAGREEAAQLLKMPADTSRLKEEFAQAAQADQAD